MLLTTIVWTSVAAPVDFDTEIMPLLTKHGCNAAACHGAAAGRGGFKLSLFGGNPAADYDAIVHELEGRRVDLARPADSLLIAKPTMMLDHGGDLRFDDDSESARLLKRWIEEGASRKQARELLALFVAPAESTVESVGGETAVRVTATFRNAGESNSWEQDVTAWAVYEADDPAAVEVTDRGRMTVLRPGQHTVVVRYLNRVLAARLITPFAHDAAPHRDDAANNEIDRHVDDLLQQLGIPVSPRADDATLLRRATLDLTGRLPRPDDVRAYLSDGDADRYWKLLDRLFDSPEFTDYWTYRFATLLRIRSLPGDREMAGVFHNWLRDQIAADVGLDQIARQMLTSFGDSHQLGPANFHRMAAGAREQAEYVSEALMGVRLRCANCHDHPLDRWTQDDYHGLAAIFARVDRGRVVRLLDRGEVSHPGTQQPAVPRIPGERWVDASANGPAELADWLTAADNPYFARAQVNRLWQAMMGRGLIEAADDVRDTNPATHPRLLDELAADFAASGFRIRHTLRQIAESAAYRRSSVPTLANAFDDRFYSHALTKPLAAEVLADAISDATGIAEAYGDQPPGTRAVQLADSKIPADSLDILGRCSRDESCESSPAVAGGMTTQLHLLNGELLNRRIAAPDGWLHRQLSARPAPASFVEAAYLRCLGRFPSPREQESWSRELADSQGSIDTAKAEDFFWSVLASREFRTNH